MVWKRSGASSARRMRGADVEFLQARTAALEQEQMDLVSRVTMLHQSQADLEQENSHLQATMEELEEQLEEASLLEARSNHRLRLHVKQKSQRVVAAQTGPYGSSRTRAEPFLSSALIFKKILSEIFCDAIEAWCFINNGLHASRDDLVRALVTLRIHDLSAEKILSELDCNVDQGISAEVFVGFMDWNSTSHSKEENQATIERCMRENTVDTMVDKALTKKPRGWNAAEYTNISPREGMTIDADSIANMDHVRAEDRRPCLPPVLTARQKFGFNTATPSITKEEKFKKESDSELIAEILNVKIPEQFPLRQVQRTKSSPKTNMPFDLFRPAQESSQIRRLLREHERLLCGKSDHMLSAVKSDRSWKKPAHQKISSTESIYDLDGRLTDHNPTHSMYAHSSPANLVYQQQHAITNKIQDELTESLKTSFFGSLAKEIESNYPKAGHTLDKIAQRERQGPNSSGNFQNSSTVLNQNESQLAIQPENSSSERKLSIAESERKTSICYSEYESQMMDAGEWNARSKGVSPALDFEVVEQI